MKFARSPGQLPLPKKSDVATLDVAEIVSEFMDLMGLANDARIADIRERIPDPAYRRNFLGLAKKIAPDGERISLVGYTTTTKGETRKVSVTKRVSEFLRSTDINGQPTEPQLVELDGTLLYADAIGKDRIKIIDNQQKSHTLNVPEGMMNDIVRPMWDSHVTARGRRKGNSIVLEDIQATE